MLSDRSQDGDDPDPDGDLDAGNDDLVTVLRLEGLVTAIPAPGSLGLLLLGILLAVLALHRLA